MISCPVTRTSQFVLIQLLPLIKSAASIWIRMDMCLSVIDVLIFSFFLEFKHFALICVFVCILYERLRPKAALPVVHQNPQVFCLHFDLAAPSRACGRASARRSWV